VSTRADRPDLPDDRGAWIKTKCLSRAESVVVGWTGPEGSRPFLGTLLLGYFDNDGRLLYAGRVGMGMSQKTLALLHRRLKPLVIRAMPLVPKETRFGGKLALSRVHWVRPKLVAKSPISVGPRTACFAAPSSWLHAKTHRRARSGARSLREHAKWSPCVARNLPEEQNRPRLP
jgi:ATP-dependent DNA ligase